MANIVFFVIVAMVFLTLVLGGIFLLIFHGRAKQYWYLWFFVAGGLGTLFACQEGINAILDHNPLGFVLVVVYGAFGIFLFTLGTILRKYPQGFWGKEWASVPAINRIVLISSLLICLLALLLLLYRG